VVLWCALFFAIGAVGTWGARAYALQRNLIDQPGERRSHDTATPRGGGIAIVLALLIAAVALAWRDASAAPLLIAFGIGLLIVAGIGWWDDHRSLPASWRLAVHALAAVLLAWATLVAFGDGWLAAAAFVAAMVLTNVWNFMDGIDGLAASQAALVASAFAVALPGSAWGLMGWALVAASLGFLPFNFPRARIFLGDVGSGALGFALAALAIVVAGGQDQAAPLVLLPLSAFVIDAGLTLGRRMLRGERWWMAHAQHAYQACARKQRSHVAVTIGYGIWTVLAVLLAARLQSQPLFFMLACVLAWYMSGAFLWWWLQRSSADSECVDQTEWRSQ